ncbi:MAG: DNA repair protein RadA [Actinomycetota bacterium]|nr:DNA repair protein RadA [Actinomycetota bacterium]
MARSDTQFVCQSCGHSSLRWAGQCAGCGEWNTLVEQRRPEAEAKAMARAGGRSRAGTAAKPVALRDVSQPAVERVKTHIDELDRVLGGGLVPGSIVLMGGSPGIGKSTLTGMALGNLVAAGRRTLYVSGEESAAQVRMRATRLGDHALAVPVIAETSLETVLATLEAERPEACVIDSIQTMNAEGMTGAPGSVGQVREAANAILEVAKRIDCAVFLVGHVTKEGAVAGPRVLEHLVDCVLLFEGERERSFRTLRALKNRFGATSEVGVFEMRGGGLVEVQDPSARFVGEASGAPGSCVLCSMEGTRPLLVEVQALVAPTEVVPPRRVANGVDRNRLAMILAVLARHGGPGLSSADVFVNVAGGVRIDEPGADLAVAMAIVSAHRGEPLADPAGRPMACFGEVGLTGELRSVGHSDRRLAEAIKFGLTPVIGPPDTERLAGLASHKTLRSALAAAFARRAARRVA